VPAHCNEKRRGAMMNRCGDPNYRLMLWYLWSLNQHNAHRPLMWGLRATVEHRKQQSFFNPVMVIGTFISPPLTSSNLIHTGPNVCPLFTFS
jgi:hypothetical protein